MRKIGDKNYTDDYTIHINDEPLEPFDEEECKQAAAEIGIPYEDLLQAWDKGLYQVEKIREFSANLQKHSD